MVPLMVPLSDVLEARFEQTAFLPALLQKLQRENEAPTLPFGQNQPLLPELFRARFYRVLNPFYALEAGERRHTDNCAVGVIRHTNSLTGF